MYAFCQFELIGSVSILELQLHHTCAMYISGRFDQMMFFAIHSNGRERKKKPKECSKLVDWKM